MSTKIIKSKNFFHNNLTLQLIFDSDFNLFYIEIYRHNENKSYNLHGCFVLENDAITKFNQIQL